LHRTVYDISVVSLYLNTENQCTTDIHTTSATAGALVA
jgi:hypothetical protein